ncbi:hypothetical protein HJC99_05615 [Candidatus Saccharibacteria bacterium]|nr:hypothetical protein [Candidatus Saccharibacteria bacterium]
MSEPEFPTADYVSAPEPRRPARPCRLVAKAAGYAILTYVGLSMAVSFGRYLPIVGMLVTVITCIFMGALAIMAKRRLPPLGTRLWHALLGAVLLGLINGPLITWDRIYSTGWNVATGVLVGATAGWFWWPQKRIRRPLTDHPSDHS